MAAGDHATALQRCPVTHESTRLRSYSMRANQGRSILRLQTSGPHRRPGVPLRPPSTLTQHTVFVDDQVPPSSVGSDLRYQVQPFRIPVETLHCAGEQPAVRCSHCAHRCQDRSCSQPDQDFRTLGTSGPQAQGFTRVLNALSLCVLGKRAGG